MIDENCDLSQHDGLDTITERWGAVLENAEKIKPKKVKGEYKGNARALKAAAAKEKAGLVDVMMKEYANDLFVLLNVRRTEHALIARTPISLCVCVCVELEDNKWVLCAPFSLPIAK